MKIFAVFILCVSFVSNFCSMCGNVPQSSDGIFHGLQSLQQGRGAEQKRLPSAIFEQRDDSGDTNVFDIHGLEQFERLIVKNSYYRPVVLKLYLPNYKGIAQINEIFQDVAQGFNNKIIFAGLNISKNKQLYMRINNFCNLKNVELPLFLFYEKGQLRMPFLSGLQPKDYFVEYIQKLFFSEQKK
ncbi:MAG: hypothetical protein US49_C0007G0005 [candidate division TM6 bacterium GW2011_GWF2_37_49]|nr:MAG: hypothetical protein US49_C0007G0005 [candidate division TM6 bacterium GW2011_GWF2_37_49]